MFLLYIAKIVKIFTVNAYFKFYFYYKKSPKFCPNVLFFVFLCDNF